MRDTRREESDEHSLTPDQLRGCCLMLLSNDFLERPRHLPAELVHLTDQILQLYYWSYLPNIDNVDEQTPLLPTEETEAYNQETPESDAAFHKRMMTYIFRGWLLTQLMGEEAQQ